VLRGKDGVESHRIRAFHQEKKAPLTEKGCQWEKGQTSICLHPWVPVDGPHLLSSRQPNAVTTDAITRSL